MIRRTILLLTLIASPTGAQQWKSAVDPASQPPPKPRLDLKLTIPIKQQVKTAVSDRPSAFVAVCDDNPFGPRAWGLLNLQTGVYTPAFAEKAAALEDPLISPDGQYVAGKTRGERNAGAALEVWSLKAKRGLHRLRSGDDHWPPVPLGFAADERLLSTTNLKFKPKLQAWDLKTGKQAWEVDLPKPIEPKNVATSPGGKYLAVLVENKLTLYDAATGNVFAEAALPDAPEKAPFGSQPKGLAFSSDGAQLAAFCEHGMGKSRLLIWDCATGNVLADRLGDMPKDDRWNRAGERKLEFFEGGRLLRFADHVIDRETGQPVYTVPQSRPGRKDELVKALGEDRVLIVSEKDQDKAYVTVATLPKAEVEKGAAVVRAGGKSTDAGLPPLAKADYSGVRTVLETAPAGAWSLKADAGPARLAGANSPIPIRAHFAPGGDQYWVKRVIYSGPPANQAAVLYHVTSKGNKKTIVDRVTLAGAAGAGSFEFPDHADLLDFGSDGKSVLIKHGEDRVDLYSLAAGPTPKPILGFRPYEGDKQTAAVKVGGIVSPEQFFTVGQFGRFVLWTASAQGPKAIYEIATKGDDFTFSPNRKQLAYANGEGVTILDPAAGQILAIIPGPKSWNSQLAFHPDGTKLAHFASSPYPHLLCYDLTTGQTIADLAAPKESWIGPVAWAGQNHVVVGGFLADLQKKLVVWHYQRDGFTPKTTGQPDDRYWAYARGEVNGPSAIVPAVVPHPEAQRFIASLKDDNYVVKPGTKVSVEVNVIGDEDFRKKVADALVRHATAAGLLVGEGQKIVLSANTIAKEGKTQEYHVIGGNPARQTATIPYYECNLKITADGQTYWEATSAAGGLIPMIPRLQQGQTVQDLIDKVNANPGSQFYLTCAVPGTIAKPLDTLVSSKITTKGIVPVKP